MTADGEEWSADRERRPRGPYAKSAERRQQIIDKAIEIFARDGVDAGSLRSVAAAIGVSHAALRHYFPTREALLIAVYEAHEVRTDETIDAWLGEDDSPLPAMRASASRNRSVPGLVQLYASLTAAAVQTGNPGTRAFIRERFTSLRKQIAQRVERAQEHDHMIGDADPAEVASLIIAAADGLQIQWLIDPDSVAVERGLALLERLLESPPDRA
ncbi:TetR/AcrR family transcriptional regulator [Curtobacterium ammoniigenes]|uniref:TetR/AcrR family transcriptional regulator n=1 Tax=Curtobacterium ammoniigenes TaxID=395387 RepID=UPI00082C5E13|nr:TetR/AcrR family transcriptional regulator [Curtobacterium ammoniigenes]